MEIINLLDINTEPFTLEDLLKATRNISNKKAVGLDEIPAEVWKLDDFKEFLLESCNSVYNQDPIESWRKGCILPFPKKGDLSTLKNYIGITLTQIAAKIYNLVSRRYPAENIADVDYADDIALASNSQTDENKMLLKIESATKYIGLFLNAEKQNM